MIDTLRFFNEIKKSGISFFSGVPDSLLSDFCACVEDNCKNTEHLIAANEGNAIGLAAGHYLATGNPALVYLQNSGLGNIINPITSLTDAEVYKIPALLMIGWRGEPGHQDEPQHIKQGRITREQLDLLEIPYFILDADSDGEIVIRNAISKIEEIKSPVAILVRNNTFSVYKKSKKESAKDLISRESALEKIIYFFGEDLVISTTGKASREIFEIRKKNGQNQQDFLTVGSMGHASSIALGISISSPKKSVICIDGDGSALMHMGAMAIAGTQKNIDFTHIILNNAAHDSVGGQSTVADQIDFGLIARACGYVYYKKAQCLQSLEASLLKIKNIKGVKMLEITISKGSRKDLGRPDSTPEENKKNFMKKITG